MAGNLFTLPKQVPIDAGVVLGASTLTFTQTGTSTLQNTYTDVALTVAHANPVVASSEGIFEPIYFDPSFGDYRVRLENSVGGLIYQVDGIPASQSGQALTLTAAAPFIDLIESDAAANNTTWRIGVNGEQLTLQLANDALSAFVDVLTIDRTANVCDLLNLIATDVQLNTVSILEVAGSFTGTLTGMTSATTGTVNYIVKGNICTLYRDASGFAGTSNTTALTMTGLPAAVQPSSNVQVPCTIRDNSVDVIGDAGILSASPTLITFRVDATLSVTGFTAANDKGLPPGWSITYVLS